MVWERVPCLAGRCFSLPCLAGLCFSQPICLLISCKFKAGEKFLTCGTVQGQLSASQVALGDAQLKVKTEMQQRISQLEVSVSDTYPQYS